MTPAGYVDSTFGSAGVVAVQLGNGYSDVFNGLAVDPLDRVVVVGTSSATGPADIAVVRVHGGDQRLFVQQDANHNVTSVASHAGVVIDRYHYTPYGTRTVLNADFSVDTDGQSDADFRHGHQGLAIDQETGLYYNRARLLHPTLGRFTQRDPLGYVDGMSVYQYVSSSPLSRVDPSGLVEPDATALITVTTELIFGGLGTTFDLLYRAGIEVGNQFRNEDRAYYIRKVNCSAHASHEAVDFMPGVILAGQQAGIIRAGDITGRRLEGPWLDRGSNKFRDSIIEYLSQKGNGFMLNNCSDKCPCGYVKIAFETYDPSWIDSRDYHFYRYDPISGQWTHKLRGVPEEDTSQPFITRDSDPLGCFCFRPDNPTDNTGNALPHSVACDW